MAGRTDMVVGRRHNRFIHVPIAHVVSERNQVAPDGDLWLSVLESTAQPMIMAMSMMGHGLHHLSGGRGRLVGVPGDPAAVAAGGPGGVRLQS